MSSRLVSAERAVREAGLRGQRVLVTRPPAQAGELVRRLRALGAEAVLFPTIRIAPPADSYAALDAALRQLASFTWVVFTSVNGVDYVWRRLAVLGLDTQAFDRARLAAIGPATAAALEARGLQVEIVPVRYVAEALLEALPAPTGQRLLLPRAAGARDILRAGLEAAGAEVVEVHAYRAVRAEPTPAALAALDAGVDILTFTSSSTVRHFAAQVGPERLRSLAARARLAVIGPVTAGTARELGLRVDIEAAEHTVAGLIDAIVAAL
jgi:uroporphyrinogen-III synthase